MIKRFILNMDLTTMLWIFGFFAVLAIVAYIWQDFET